jgi:hypothetical protein
MANFLICLILTIATGRFKTKAIIKLISVGILLIFIPTALYGIDNIDTIFGFFIRISIGCMIVLYFKDKFFTFFENLIFILALISIPLYAIQIVDIKFFDFFKNFSELVLSQVRLTMGQGVLTGHRYLVVFLVNSWGEDRNSGFGWEPAVFGAILCWAILINLFLNKNKVNVKLVIMFIAAITTFSIGTFIALAIIYIYFVWNNKKKTKFIIVGALIFLFISSLSYYSETQKRFDQYVINTNEGVFLKNQQGNRLDAIVYGSKSLITRPWGYGVRNKPIEILGFPNGFVVLTLQFGIIGILIILFLLFRLFNILNKFYMAHFKAGALFVLAIIVTLNGNPMSFQEIMFAFILSGYTFGEILKSNKIKKTRIYNAIQKKSENISYTVS